MSGHVGCDYCHGHGHVMALDMVTGPVSARCPYTRCQTCQRFVFPHCTDCDEQRELAARIPLGDHVLPLPGLDRARRTIL